MKGLSNEDEGIQEEIGYDGDEEVIKDLKSSAFGILCKNIRKM